MIAKFILIGLLFVKLGIRLNKSENIVEATFAGISCGLMVMLYYFAGLFDGFS